MIISSKDCKAIKLVARDEDLGGECEIIGELTLECKDILNGKYKESSWLKFDKKKGEVLFFNYISWSCTFSSSITCCGL